MFFKSLPTLGHSVIFHLYVGVLTWFVFYFFFFLIRPTFANSFILTSVLKLYTLKFALELAYYNRIRLSIKNSRMT